VNSGASPGYEVFKPLLYFNTVMGFIYLAVGIVIWRNDKLGKMLALYVLLANLLVAIIVAYLFLTSNLVAIQSMGAITFRTVVWFVIYYGLSKIIK